MMVMSNYATSGDVVERKFYIMIWDKYQEGLEKDILKECREFVSKLESGNIGCEILKEQEIVRLCNLINNPVYMHVEDMKFEREIPFAKEYCIFCQIYWQFMELNGII